MYDVVVSEAMAGSELDALRTMFDVVYEPELWRDPRELHERVQTARSLIVRNQTRVGVELLAAAKRLQIVARAGAGLDNIDVGAASERGIVVSYAPEQNSVSVAELVLGLMLCLARKLAAADRSTRSGEWSRTRFTGSELYGKTLGIVGLGRIGFLVAMRAKAFGMRVLAHDEFVNPDSAVVGESGAVLVELDTLLERSDVITLHVPITPQTRGFFGYGRFCKMKPSAWFINASRGEIVREDDLLRALSERRIAGAALDVRAHEPPGVGALEAMENVVLTPHVGAFTTEGQERVVRCVCRDVESVLRGGSAKNFYNFPTPRLGGLE